MGPGEFDLFSKLIGGLSVAGSLGWLMWWLERVDHRELRAKVLEAFVSDTEYKAELKAALGQFSAQLSAAVERAKG